MLQLCGERVGSWLLRSFALKDSFETQGLRIQGSWVSGFRV